MITSKQNNPGAARFGLVLLSVAFLLAGVQPAAAVPQIMNDYGDQMAWRSAEINSMGGTGVALYRGGMSNIFNPAFLADEESVRIDLGFSLDQEHEDRFVPLFNSFDSFVEDAAIASNRFHYWQSNFALAQRLNTEGMPVTLGLSLTDRNPFQYNFYEEVRNPAFYPEGDRDVLIEEREFEVSGTLRNLSMGAGLELHERFSLGATVHYAFGKRKETTSVSDNWEEDGSYRIEEEMDLEGLNFTLGLKSTLNNRMEIGFAWESQLLAEGDTSGEMHFANPDSVFTSVSIALSDTYFRYPNIFRGGLTFRPRTDPKTVFTMELEYIPWDEMADSRFPGYDNPRNLQDTKDVRIGLEHTFYNGSPMRFGFRHANSYLDRDASCSFFTAGVGIPYSKGMFSASLELGKVVSIQDHIFPYVPSEELDEAYEADPQARVVDTRFRLGVGYSLSY
ncbi:MAG: hypothetical protein KOO60_10100 [Gemmatimonadales bacterium]|nr:hypothetical protein [Gemmatimonadales bacterium]